MRILHIYFTHTVLEFMMKYLLGNDKYTLTHLMISMVANRRLLHNKIVSNKTLT